MLCWVGRPRALQSGAERGSLRYRCDIDVCKWAFLCIHVVGMTEPAALFERSERDQRRAPPAGMAASELESLDVGQLLEHRMDGAP
jgi:hypothetical protein